MLFRSDDIPLTLYLSVGYALFSEVTDLGEQKKLCDIRLHADYDQNISAESRLAHSSEIFRLFDDLPISYSVYHVTHSESNGQYDAVIVDAPPQGILADTDIIARHADITLYLIRAGQVVRKYFSQVQKLADAGKLPNVAYVLNAVDFRAHSYNYYGYGYAYGYYRYGYSAKGKKEIAK